MASLGRSAIGANLSMRGAAASALPSLVGREGRASGARRQSAVVCHSTGPQHPGPLPAAAAGQRRQVATRAKPGETPEQALERRIRESAQVEERVIHITSQAEWDREVEKAGNKLVVLEVQSDVLCQTGFEEEAELQWKADKRAALAPCSDLKHTFARTARECGDVVFLSLEVEEGEEGDAGELCDRLGIDVLPTLQFWRGGQKVWEHKGVVALDQDLGEGVLYYGDTAGNNVKASQYVTELASKDDLHQFVNSQPESVLTVVNVSLLSAAPCVHIFPAVLALARNFTGYAAFARLLGDGSPQLLAELDIKEVPTFLFYRNGQEVGRHVGSSRGDLIGHILGQQAALGIQPPKPPSSAGGGATKRPMRRGRIRTAQS